MFPKLLFMFKYTSLVKIGKGQTLLNSFFLIKKSFVDNHDVNVIMLYINFKDEKAIKQK